MGEIELEDLGGQNPFDVVAKLFEREDIELKTELNMKEIHSVALILFLSDYLKLPIFEKFIKNILRLKVSKDRKGREEFIELFKELKDKEDKKTNLEERLVRGV